MLKAKRVAQFCQTYPVMPGCEELRQCPPGGCMNGQCVFGYCNCNAGWGGPNCMDLLGVPVAIAAPHYIPPTEYQPPVVVTMPPWIIGPSPAPGPTPCPFTNLPGPCPAPGPAPCPFTNLPGPCPAPAPGPAPCPLTGGPGPCPAPAPCPPTGGPGPCPAPAPGPAPCPKTGGPGPCPAPAPGAVAFVASSSRGLNHPGNNSSSHISSAPGHPILEANQSRSFSLKSFLTPAASTSGNNATSERQLRASRHVLLQADSLAG